MEKKNLAKEYATARLQGRLSGNETQFNGHEVFTETDIENAFNAGRESVVDNIPELEWKVVNEDNVILRTPFGRYSIRYKMRLLYGGVLIKQIKDIKEAKQAANEDYKQRIKQVLGL